MLAKDEADIVEDTVRHLLAEVDRVIVADNLSTDGTREILARLAEREPALAVLDDEEVGYWQSRKTTALAMRALDEGHRWVVPSDADEFWYAPDGRRVADFLDGLAPDVQLVSAAMYHHVPTVLDPPEPCGPCGQTGGLDGPWGGRVQCSDCEGLGRLDTFRRIGWRKRQHGAMPKVACRLRPDLVIAAGNHDATTTGTATRSGGLVIRHYSWRSPGQYLRKIRNGEAAYAATDLPASVGEHWRGYAGRPDEAILSWFREWGFSADPGADDSLIYDPAPRFGRP